MITIIMRTVAVDVVVVVSPQMKTLAFLFFFPFSKSQFSEIMIIMRHLDPILRWLLVLVELCEAVDWGGQFW